MIITASVVPGDSRGRQLGFPTLNVDYQSDFPEGVYAVWCQLDDSKEWLPAACHIGARPTFDSRKTLEVHVIGRELTETPRKIRIALGQQLRGVQRFSGREALVEQIKTDILQAQSYCDTHDPPA